MSDTITAGDLAVIETMIRDVYPYDGWECAETELRDLITKVRGLRAILAPLLDQPIHGVIDVGAARECIFCREGWLSWKPLGVFTHKPDCPVLRRDELLGRE